MEQLLYSDLEGQYFLLDYSPSHSEMVIRRTNNKDAHDVFNIDLFFKAICNIQLPTKMEGVKIYRIDRRNTNIVMPNVANRKEIYKIVDGEGNTGFVDASVFVVFQNSLDILETSLGDFTWTNENREIFSAAIQR